MADAIPSMTEQDEGSTKVLSASPITSAPSLTRHRDLVKRWETVEDNICGWVNGNKSNPLVCDWPYRQPCLWSPELHVVGCCPDHETSHCAWATSCVPWSDVNYGCDSACQNNALNTICESDRPYCATAYFEGSGGYTFLSCSDSYEPTTHTIAVTYYGGDATVESMPRYFSDYWYSSSVSSSTSSGSHTASTSTSTASTATSTSTHIADSVTVKTESWFAEHKWAIIGAIGGVVCFVLLLFIGCCCFCRKRGKGKKFTPWGGKPGKSGKYTPAPQCAPGSEGYPMLNQMQTTAYQQPYQHPTVYRSEPYDQAYAGAPKEGRLGEPYQPS